jgi:hypothetical protein
MSNMTVKKKFHVRALADKVTFYEAEKVAANSEVADISHFLDNDDREEYITGPLVERLHAFEEIGYEPEEIKSLLSLKVDRDHRVDRELINDILDRIENCGCMTLSIFVGSEGTSIDIRPYEPCEVSYEEETDEEIEVTRPYFPCSTCKRITECEGLKMAMNTAAHPCEDWVVRYESK